MTRLLHTRFARREDLGLARGEFAILARLSTPERMQAFLNAVPSNHEPDGETILSVREVLRQRRAHCIEGAFVAACALWIHGEPPLVTISTATRAMFPMSLPCSAVAAAGARSPRPTARC